MRIKRRLIEKPIAACMVLLLVAPVARAEPSPGQEAAAGQETQATPPTVTQQAASASDYAPNLASGTTAQSPSVEAPSSSSSPAPSAEVAQNADQTAPASGSQAGSPPPSASQSNNEDQQQNGAAQPVGTAAAPAVNGTGVAGSRVSGAAIAPAKQRRVRTFLISIAVVVAACVAVGTVVALTHATPSQPR
jgi:hypothetical protein